MSVLAHDDAFFLQQRCKYMYVYVELPPLFSGPLGLKGMPSTDTTPIEKTKSINFTHSFDILDLPSYDAATIPPSFSNDDFDNI